ncbi:S-adenosyl-L-methionine-dependent methyltransferases superfamily protein [Artemisia annua]|uniref:S-adenosyl-L-methionine-dependent methyltransferases superfamily protein n=1 Tax=Artemisia annua TaxID=35608 RepID=A0A2U1PYG7_ARTAN|nr:S-adenosyl-L-methionine-dependent methyltransferases superfamily protein [Artemisia annua]
MSLGFVPHSLSNSDDEEEQESYDNTDTHLPSKFSLYQQSVQSPKGDISYLQMFFLTYVGGRAPLHLQEDFCGTALLRAPLHLQEDFCGTALLSTEWLRSDLRRTSVGLDFDLDALDWCIENNVNKVGLIYLLESSSTMVTSYNHKKLNCRHELVSYFKHALNALSKKGGIFVMDLYGGTSSECELKMQRKFPNFTYTWEQAGFDIIQRKTRISLHYTLLNHQKKKLRHAFSYSWRLWSLPEIKDCMEEAGFRSVHFWIRQMPDSENIKSMEGFGSARDIKYEEVTSFQQQDSWNAYIVAVS